MAASASASATAPAALPPPPASTEQHEARVQQAEAFVRHAIAGHDSSHDWWHVERVRNTALALAQREQLPKADQQLAELAALLHDVADHKYSADTEADRARLQLFLSDPLALSEADQGAVMYVIDSMGFNAELARQQSQQAQQHGEQQGEQQGQQGQQERRRERILAVVQDADRLDAIGAIGIARCLTFGGRFNRVLHDPAVPPRTALTHEQYTDKAATAQQTTLNHFQEKLLRLKGLMRTAAGREVAEGRHAYMEQFLDRFHAEWRADA